MNRKRFRIVPDDYILPRDVGVKLSHIPTIGHEKAV